MCRPCPGTSNEFHKRFEIPILRARDALATETEQQLGQERLTEARARAFGPWQTGRTADVRMPPSMRAHSTQLLDLAVQFTIRRTSTILSKYLPVKGASARPGGSVRARGMLMDRLQVFRSRCGRRGNSGLCRVLPHDRHAGHHVQAFPQVQVDQEADRRRRRHYPHRHLVAQEAREPYGAPAPQAATALPRLTGRRRRRRRCLHPTGADPALVYDKCVERAEGFEDSLELFPPGFSTKSFRPELTFRPEFSGKFQVLDTMLAWMRARTNDKARAAAPRWARWLLPPADQRCATA